MSIILSNAIINESYIKKYQYYKIMFKVLISYFN